MTPQEKRRETRRQNALDRLGANNPRCTICGEDDWRTSEFHHIAGRAFDDDGAILCRNCHRKLSDDQKDHPKPLEVTPSTPERIGHFLLGLADLLAMLVEKLRAFGADLIGVAGKTASAGRLGHEHYRSFTPDHDPRSRAEENCRARLRASAAQAGTREGQRPQRPQRDASQWLLLFDTETTVDARQALRFGAFQVRDGARLDSAGVFFDPETLSPEEGALLQAYAEREGLECMTVAEFIEGVFFRVGYQWRGTIVGFNLPFDLSRLALRHGSARSATMRGGFTFTLSTKPWLPKVQVKHLNSKSALIQFTKPARKPETRWELRKHGKRPPKRGAFIDLKTHAAALLSNSFSLASLGAFLEVEHCKQHVEAHGGPLTEGYIGYCLNDVQTTYECDCACGTS